MILCQINSIFVLSFKILLHLYYVIYSFKVLKLKVRTKWCSITGSDILYYNIYTSPSWAIQSYVIKFVQLLATDRWFSLSTPVSSIKKTDRHNMVEILLKKVLNNITISPSWVYSLILYRLQWDGEQKKRLKMEKVFQIFYIYSLNMTYYRH